MRRFALAALLLVAGCVARPPEGSAVAVSASSVAFSTDPAATQSGRLRAMGGLVFASTDPRFGGLSGLRVRADGWALAVSDTGAWAGFRLVERGGRLTGIERFAFAPMRDARGNPPAAKDDADAESLEWRADGSVTVGFEQDHRFETFTGIDPSRSASFAARPATVSRPNFIREWPKNGGAEAFAALGPDSDLVISEHALLASDVHDTGVTFDGQLIRCGTRMPTGFVPTEAVSLGQGRALLLGRHFTKADGVSAVVVLADYSNAKPGATIETRELARLAPPMTVDNMEGMALRREGSRTFIYLISDDNQDKAQRTLLLKFELLP